VVGEEVMIELAAHMPTARVAAMRAKNHGESPAPLKGSAQ
jgi:hypothetical protein